MCQRSSNHKLKAIHNKAGLFLPISYGVSKIVKSQIESNSQLIRMIISLPNWCVKDRQITNWKQFTTRCGWYGHANRVCQRSSNHKLKAIHNASALVEFSLRGVSKIVKSQIESNSQPDCNTHVFWWGVSKIVKSQIESNSQLPISERFSFSGCVKDRQITNWKQFTTM